MIVVCVAQLATTEETDDLNSRIKVLSLDLLQVCQPIINFTWLVLKNMGLFCLMFLAMCRDCWKAWAMPSLSIITSSIQWKHISVMHCWGLSCHPLHPSSRFLRRSLLISIASSFPYSVCIVVHDEAEQLYQQIVPSVRASVSCLLKAVKKYKPSQSYYVLCYCVPPRSDMEQLQTEWSYWRWFYCYRELTILSDKLQLSANMYTVLLLRFRESLKVLNYWNRSLHFIHKLWCFMNHEINA